MISSARKTGTFATGGTAVDKTHFTAKPLYSGGLQAVMAVSCSPGAPLVAGVLTGPARQKYGVFISAFAPKPTFTWRPGARYAVRFGGSVRIGQLHDGQGRENWIQFEFRPGGPSHIECRGLIELAEIGALAVMLPSARGSDSMLETRACNALEQADDFFDLAMLMGCECPLPILVMPQANSADNRHARREHRFRRRQWEKKER